MEAGTLGNINSQQKHIGQSKVGLQSLLARWPLRLFKMEMDAATRPPARPTAWMDGLRGLAAVSVIGCHYFYFFGDALFYGYGANDKTNILGSNPLVRLLVDGHNDVNYFFIISGYVVSLGALQAMTANNLDKALPGLNMSVFRRFFRLYLPVYALNLLCTVLAFFGAYEFVRPYLENKAIEKAWFPGAFSEPHMRRFASPFQQLIFWFNCMTSITNPFRNENTLPRHDVHLWTIQIEFRLSLHLYIVLLGLARCKPHIRTVLLFVIGWCYFYGGIWAAPLFFCGAALAQYNVIQSVDVRSKSELPTRLESTSQSSDTTTQIVRSLCWALALYISSVPLYNQRGPAWGYAWTNSLLPSQPALKERFWKIIGCIAMISLLATSKHQMSSPHPGLWHRVLTHRIPQYFGKLMFGIYLVHGHILHMFGLMVPHAIWYVIGSGSLLNYFIGLVLGFLINAACCLVAANLFHVYIETQAASLTKKLEALVFVPVA